MFIQRPNLVLRELSQEATPFKTYMNMVKHFNDPYILPLRSTPHNEAEIPAEPENDAEEDSPTPAEST
uniref:Uncharacterized protein n=1 Tax=Panagrolaimus superbus TaxID=310955 RepID=A0A914ZCT0_9BILA